MKLSKYIESLQHLLDTDGDMDCVVWEENDDWDSPNEGWYAAVTKRDIEHKISTVCTYITNQGMKEFCSTNLVGYIDCVKEKVLFVRD